MIPVTISEEAFLRLDADTFGEWCDSIGIADQDWNFKEGPLLRGGSETFFFRHEEHAVMFRLKYGA